MRRLSGWRLLPRIALAIGLIAALASSTTHAWRYQGSGDPSIEARGFQQNRDYFSPLPFENIDMTTGGLVLSFTDLTLPGPAGFNLAFSRYYNVKSGAGNATIGWSMGLAGLPGSVSPREPVTIPGFPELDPHGHGALSMPVFTTADGAEHATLEPSAGGQPLFTKDFWRYTPSSREVRLPNGLICKFVDDGVVDIAYLSEVRDPFDNVVTIVWETVGTGRRIHHVTQSLGGQSRGVFFTYDGTTGLLRTMAEGGRTWTYEWTTYLGNALLQKAYLPTSDPVQQTGPVWTYAYAEQLITSVTTPQGGIVSYTWDFHRFWRNGEGQPLQLPNSLVLKTRTTSGREIEGGLWTLSYDGLENITTLVGPTKTLVYESSWIYGQLIPANRKVWSGTELNEIEDLEYGAISLNLGPEDIGNPDLYFYVPVLVSRGLARDSHQWETTYGYSASLSSTPAQKLATQFGNCGQPNLIVASGDLTRTADVVYEDAFTPYICSRPKQITTTVNGASSVRTFGHDLATGFRTSVTVDGVTTGFQPTPDGRGNVWKATDANGQVTEYEYAWGVQSTVHTPKYTIGRTINPSGTIESETRRTFTTWFEYDLLDRVKKVTPPLGYPTSTTYAPDGTTMTVTRGVIGSPTSTVTTTFDGFGRTIGAVTDADVDIRTRTEYDAAGRKVYQSYPYTDIDRGDRFEYDALDRLKKVIHPAVAPDPATFVTTDYDGAVVTVTDELGHITTQHWQAFGDPSDARLGSVTDAASKVWTYSYNVHGSLTGVQAPPESGAPNRIWNYNGQNRLTSETQPESGTTTYSLYDPVGNLKTKTDARNQEFNYTYDSNHRLEVVNAPGTVDDVFIAYNESDLRTSVTMGGVTTAFVYDDANRMTKRTETINGRAFVSEFGYDGHDNLTSITYPSGLVVSYEYDIAGRVTAVKRNGTVVVADQFTYHPSGAIASYRLANDQTPNDPTETVTFDERYRPKHLVSGPLDLTYTYDGANNVIELTDSRPGFSSSYEYDILDRLKKVWDFGATEFTYDTLGNRKTKGVGANQVVYAYHPTTLRLSTATSALGVPETGTFTYDGAGNMELDGSGGEYTYTPFHMLETAKVADATTTYTYDADQIRVMKSGADGVRYYVHGIGSQQLAEYRETAGGPQLVRESLYLGARLLAAIEPTPPAAPVARVTGVSFAPQSAKFGTLVSLTVTGATQPCSKVEVDFGDGTITPYTIASPYQLPLVVTHTYAAVGFYTIIARGQAGPSGPCTGTVSSPLEVTSGDVVVNGYFDQGLGPNGLPVGWGMYSSGGPISWSLTNGLSFYRHGNATQAVVMQYTGLALPPGAPLETTFDMGNSDTVPKRLLVIIHNAAFDDLAVCSFWLDPGQTPRPYTMRMHTTLAWTDATLAFYAADANAPASTGAYQLNHVTLTHRPALSSLKTDCVDPLAPTAGGDVLGNFLVNSYFTSGTLGWTLSGQMTSQVTNDTLEFYRTPGAPAPKIEQVTVQAAGEDQRVAATFELGNTSPTRQRVTVQLQDANPDAPFMTVCTFWLAPSMPKALYAMTTYASRLWANATVVVLPVTAGGASTHAWLQLDTVTLAKITDPILGTECFEPGSFELDPGGNLHLIPEPAVAAPVAAEGSTTREADEALDAGIARPAGPVLAVALTVNLPGTGSGLVTSSPAGLSCGGTAISCTGWFAEHATVTLTAAPEAGSTFVGWTGACSGTGTCVLSALGTPDITATFSGPLTITYYHLDVLGSVRAITDALGNVVARYDYFAFGEGTPLSGDPHRFTGKQRDPETAFDYFEARYYRNVWGRFTTVDPLMSFDAGPLDPQRWNRYSYCTNNPLRFVDPSGMSQERAGMLLDQDINDLIAGRIDEKEYWARVNARGKGALIGVGVIVLAGAAMESAPVVALESGMAAAAAKMGGAAEKLWNFVTGGAQRRPDLPERLYHYTNTGNVSSITEQGLLGSRVYLTPNGGLTPVQAQVELALGANRGGFPTALLRVNTNGLTNQLITGPQRIQGTATAGGGGTQYVFSGPIPAAAVTVIKK